MTYDCLIIGSGPAGLSAALQCRAKGLSALLIGNPTAENPLGKAPLVDNYLGMPAMAGQAMMAAFERHVTDARAAQVVTGRVLSAMAYGDAFALSVGSEVYQGKSVILATGVVRSRPYPGEDRLLGRGVSYCAACDGMLYRGRAVCVVGLAKDAAQEAAMLTRMGCQVTFIAPTLPADLPEDILYIKATRLEILGENAVTGLQADDTTLPCQGVFLLRNAVAPAALFPGLAMDGAYIRVERDMSTSLPGVFACGDCVGPPLQIAKAVGEGQVAAHSAAEWLEKRKQKG